MKVLASDTESTGATNGTYGSAFTPSNKLICISYAGSNIESNVLPIEYSATPYGDNLRRFSALLDGADLLVGFAFKHDLHWYKRYGINFRHKRIWDCQLAHFIMNYQKFPDPSLHEVGIALGRGEKIDVVKKEYWEKGIDTDGVPWDILYEYALNDADDLTWQIYLEQERLLRPFPKLRNLIFMQCQDILVTQEMEWNGLKYNLQKSKEKGREVRVEIEGITQELNTLCPIELDWNSKDHLSAFLYGGVVKKQERVQRPFKYKDGREVMKERWQDVEYILPRQIEPLPKTEVKKGGYFETNEKVLNSLHATRESRKTLDLILKRNQLSKLVGTYYEGIPKIYEHHQWEDSIIHGTINHSRTGTGRLASSKPNQQNMDKKVLSCIETRF